MLPGDAARFLHDNVLNPQSPVQGFRRAGSQASQSAYRTVWPVVEPVLDRVTQALYNSPDLLVVIYFLAGMFLFLQIALWMHRFMMFWVRLIWRIFFWACVAALVAAVWQVGPEAAAKQAWVLGGRLFGALSAIAAVFQQEYKKYEAQQDRAYAARQGASPNNGRSGWR